MQTSTYSRRPRVEPDYAAALYEVRDPLFQHMDADTRRAWRLVSRHARGAVHECTRALEQQADGTTTDEELRLLRRLPHLTHRDVQRMDTRLLPCLPIGLQSLALSCQGPAPQQQLSALSSFRALRTFSVECWGDITPLRSCAALANLHLQLSCSNDVPYSPRALAALAGCPLLRTLRLQLHVEDDGDADNALDLSPLAWFPALRHLSVYLVNHNVLHLPMLPPSLRTLKLRCCSGGDLLSCLSSCPSLHTLKLVYCQDVDDLSALTHCPGVHTLHAKGCFRLYDISQVASCTALCEANLAGSCRINDLTPLAPCNSLRTLVVSHISPPPMDLEYLRKAGLKITCDNSYDRVAAAAGYDSGEEYAAGHDSDEEYAAGYDSDEENAAVHGGDEENAAVYGGDEEYAAAYNSDEEYAAHSGEEYGVGLEYDC